MFRQFALLKKRLSTTQKTPLLLFGLAMSAPSALTTLPLRVVQNSRERDIFNHSKAKKKKAKTELLLVLMIEIQKDNFIFLFQICI